MALNGRDLGVAVAINGITFLVCLLIFSFLRVNKYSARFFSPKRSVWCRLPLVALNSELELQSGAALLLV
jgi:hypothetical protein